MTTRLASGFFFGIWDNYSIKGSLGWLFMSNLEPVRVFLGLLTVGKYFRGDFFLLCFNFEFNKTIQTLWNLCCSFTPEEPKHIWSFSLKTFDNCIRIWYFCYISLKCFLCKFKKTALKLWPVFSYILLHKFTSHILWGKKRNLNFYLM